MSILDNVKELAGLVQKINDLELYRRILDLQSEVMALLDEIQTLKTQKKDLEKKWEIQESLQFRENAYWRESGDGPYCLPCWDKDKKLMRMAGDGGMYSCHTCHYGMITAEEKRRQEAAFSRYKL